jgi:hypothetical protein
MLLQESAAALYCLYVSPPARRRPLQHGQVRTLSILVSIPSRVLPESGEKRYMTVIST